MCNSVNSEIENRLSRCWGALTVLHVSLLYQSIWAAVFTTLLSMLLPECIFTEIVLSSLHFRYSMSHANIPFTDDQVSLLERQFVVVKVRREFLLLSLCL